MARRSKAGGFIQRRVARAGSEARRNLFARTLAGQLQPRQCLNFNGAVGAVVLVCAGIYLGLAWTQPAMALPLGVGWATGGFGLILVLGWLLGRWRRALLSAVLALGGLAGLAALAGYAWFVWTACEAVRAAGPVGPPRPSA